MWGGKLRSCDERGWEGSMEYIVDLLSIQNIALRGVMWRSNRVLGSYKR